VHGTCLYTVIANSFYSVFTKVVLNFCHVLTFSTFFNISILHPWVCGIEVHNESWGWRGYGWRAYLSERSWDNFTFYSKL